MKWVRLLLVVALAFSITSCSKKKKKEKKSHDEVVQPLKIEPAENSDE